MARGKVDVLLIGTPTQNPELKYTPNGTAILEISLGGDDHLIGGDGQAKMLAWYHRVAVFGAQAEQLANEVKQGDPLYVEGVLNYRSWEDDAGKKRSALDVKGLRVERLTFGPRGQHTVNLDTRGQPRLVDATNEVYLIGNLTRDAEARVTPTSGLPVTRFSVAANERYRDRAGTEQEKTHYVDVSVWRELAEGCASLKKGAAVYVKGRLVNDSWTDNDGVKHYATRVEGESVEFLSFGRAAGTQPLAADAPEDAKAAASFLDLDEEFPPEQDLPF